MVSPGWAAAMAAASSAWLATGRITPDPTGASGMYEPHPWKEDEAAFSPVEGIVMASRAEPAMARATRDPRKPARRRSVTSM